MFDVFVQALDSGRRGDVVAVQETEQAPWHVHGTGCRVAKEAAQGAQGGLLGGGAAVVCRRPAG